MCVNPDTLNFSCRVIDATSMSVCKTKPNLVRGGTPFKSVWSCYDAAGEVVSNDFFKGFATDLSESVLNFNFRIGLDGEPIEKNR